MRWLKGFISAVIGGAAGSISVMIADPTEFNPFGGGLKKVGIVAGITAITHAAMYLKQSPPFSERKNE